MDFPKFSNLKDPVNMGGTTGTKKYKNSRKNDLYWIIKRSEKGAGGWAQVQSEAMANNIYQVCGIPVPKQKLYTDEKALVLQEIRGRLLNECFPNQLENIRLKLGQGFVVDALLANWDVIGSQEDNIMVGNNGHGVPVRIDNGGSLTFRAQGKKKEFGPEVNELETMRDPKINPNSANYFGHLTDSVIKDQIQQIIKPNKAAILAVTSYELKGVMEKRIDYMLEWAPLISNKETAASEEVTREVEEAIVDFFWDNWNANYDLFAFANANENSAGISAAANAMYAQTQKRKNKLLRYIKYLLQTHKAKISGGFLLKAMGKFEGGDPSYDMDVYVPHASVEPFRTEMGKLFLGHQPVPADYSQINASGVATSFFTKNGIVSVRKHHRGIEGTSTYAEMDIVEANDTTSPINIIKNFDLTFCENWYDGKNVWLTHADHVEKKHGFLENHYLELLYINKPQTIGRIKKYAGRGFRVSIVNPITKKPEDITDKILAGQTVDYSAAAAAPAAQAKAKALSALEKEIEDAEIMAQSYAQDSADAHAAKEEAKKVYDKALEEYKAKFPINANHQSANAIKAYEPVKAKHKIYNDFKKKEEEATEKADKYFKIAKEKANLLKEKNHNYLQMPQRQQINTRIKPENAKTVINARNARPNVSPNNFKPNAVAEPTENLEKFLLDHPVPLNFFEIQCKDQWIGSGYTGLNAFLVGARHPNEFYDYAKFLTPYFPKEAGETDAHYQQRKLYYFFVNLYNIVQKGPAYSEVFKVYRGTRTWYLKEENAKAQFYYINSFAATSTSREVALRFGGDKSYVFYVHPSCRYMSFRRNGTDPLSEKELLLTPYHRYLYVKEFKEGKNTFKLYLIFPTDLEIPTTFDTFMPWKEGKADLSRALEGGRDIRGLTAIQPVRNKSRKRNYNKRNASRKQKNLNLLNKLEVSMPTPENKSVMPALENKSAMPSSNSLQNSLSEENVLYKLGVYMPSPENRFTDSISSFKGAPPNAKELEIAAKMVKFFEKNPI